MTEKIITQIRLLFAQRFQFHQSFAPISTKPHKFKLKGIPVLVCIVLFIAVYSIHKINSSSCVHNVANENNSWSCLDYKDW